MNNNRIIDEILRLEGWPKYTNDPADGGGPTKGGITIATLTSWRTGQGSPMPTIDDLKMLSEGEARRIYEHRYIVSPHFDEIADDLLRWHVVDCGVMSGPTRATEWLQEAINAAMGRAVVEVDGIFGEATRSQCALIRADFLGIALAGIRVRFLGRLITAKPTQSRFAAGWLARCTKFTDMIYGGGVP